MKIKQIHLKRFRQFKDSIVEAGEFNLLVGPNNSGKTSILYAVRAFFLLMSGHVFLEGSPPEARYHRRFLSSAEEIAPTPDIRELWYHKQAGNPITISITFEDDVVFTLVLRQQFGQIHVSTERLPVGLTSNKVASYLDTPVAFIPGLVGVLVNEPYATTARRNALAAEGRYSEIFRSSLQQLYSRTPTAIVTINDWLKGLFDIHVTNIAFDEDSDEYVTVKYQQDSNEYDVVSSGAGLQQVIQMLTYLYLSQPKVLLIDEPDAHLHSRLQAKLGELFRRVAADLDAQVFLSTHSLDLIDTFSTEEVIVIDPTRSTLAPLGDNVDLVSTLVDADIIEVSALSRLLSSRKLVVIEDKDQSILRAFDKAIGSQLFSSSSTAYVLPAKGVGNFRALADLGQVLEQLVDKKFDLTFIQDRDGLPDFIVTSYLNSQDTQGVKAELLERHEVESYLLEPDLIARAAENSGHNLKPSEAKRMILKAAKSLKPKGLRLSVESAKSVNRHLSKDKKYKESELEEKVYAWFDGLNSASLVDVQRHYPGKELLQETLNLLQKDKGITLTKGKLVAAVKPNLISSEIIQVIERAAS